MLGEERGAVTGTGVPVLAVGQSDTAGIQQAEAVQFCSSTTSLCPAEGRAARAAMTPGSSPGEFHISQAGEFFSHFLFKRLGPGGMA